MCFGGTPKPPAPAPLAQPRSDAARRAGELEAAARRRAAGIQGDILTTPLGISGAAAGAGGAAQRLGG